MILNRENMPPSRVYVDGLYIKEAVSVCTETGTVQVALMRVNPIDKDMMHATISAKHHIHLQELGTDVAKTAWKSDGLVFEYPFMGFTLDPEDDGLVRPDSKGRFLRTVKLKLED